MATAAHPRHDIEAMRRRFDASRGAYSVYEEVPRTSSMAGLNSGRGVHRVFEWRNHVEPGVPDGEDLAR